MIHHEGLNIAIVCSVFTDRRGGTQYIAARIANHMYRQGHKVTIIHSDPPGQPFLYPMEPEIGYMKYHNCGHHESVAALRTRLMEQDFDVCLCMQSTREHLFWAATLCGTGIPFIYSERTYPARVESPSTWSRAGRLAAISGADMVQLLFSSYASSLPACFRDKVRIVGNPAPERLLTAEPATPYQGRFRLVYVGRLSATKQAPLLVEAFILLEKDFPEWDLHIYGSGQDMPVMQTRAQGKRIFFYGDTHDPMGMCARGHIFCSPTRVEGFPNAVLEALSTGLPVVGFAQCPGVNELVKHGVNGLLAEEMTATALAETLRTLMGDASLRQRMGKAALQVRDEYGPERIFVAWESLLHEAAECKGNTVMDGFAQEPFASRACLSTYARQEFLFRKFDDPIPYSLEWFWAKLRNMAKK